MTPNAALDHLSFLVGLRLMGPDARRRLRLALVHRSDFTGPANFDVIRLERLDDLVEGRGEPQTLQERWDVARAVAERAAPIFDQAFWAARTAELIRAGFQPDRAALLIREVRQRLPASQDSTIVANMEMSNAG